MIKQAAFALGLCMLPGIAAAQYQTAYADLGGVNLDLHCKTVHGTHYKVVLVGRTAGDWKCTVDRQYGGYRHPISVEHACRLQYGRSELKAKALDWNNPLSWRCLQPHFVRPRVERKPQVRDHRQRAVVRDHRR